MRLLRLYLKSDTHSYKELREMLLQESKNKKKVRKIGETWEKKTRIYTKEESGRKSYQVKKRTRKKKLEEFAEIVEDKQAIKEIPNDPIRFEGSQTLPDERPRTQWELYSSGDKD